MEPANRALAAFSSLPCTSPRSIPDPGSDGRSPGRSWRSTGTASTPGSRNPGERRGGKRPRHRSCLRRLRFRREDPSNFGRKRYRELMAPPIAPGPWLPQDAALKADVRFSWDSPSPLPGIRSSVQAPLGRRDSEAPSGSPTRTSGIGYGYVSNRMGMHLRDPRDLAIREALYRSLGSGAGKSRRPDEKSQKGTRR
jgi:hypothetical protein